MSDVQRSRILTKDGDDKGSRNAYVMWFTNAIHQRRQLAFDGSRWWCQAKADDRTPFTPVGDSEVNPPEKARMLAFLRERFPDTLFCECCLVAYTENEGGVSYCNKCKNTPSG